MDPTIFNMYKNILVKSIKYIPLQISKNSSTPYLKENFIVFGLDNKKVRYVLIRNDVNLETCPFVGPILSRKILQENSYFRTITGMDQYPNTSTRILTHKSQFLPKLYF